MKKTRILNMTIVILMILMDSKTEYSDSYIQCEYSME